MRLRELTEHPLGVTWVVDDPLLRASHALVHDGRVWLVDPVDAPEAIERAAALGEPAGVLQLFVAHQRDGAAIAKRLGVPFHVLPDVLPGLAVLASSTSTSAVEGARAVVARSRAGWSSRSRSAPPPHYALGPGPAGVHFLRRAAPAEPAEPFLPEHLLVGHGEPVHGGDAAAALLDALNRSRRDLPAFVLERLRDSCAACRAAAEVACASCSPSTTTPSTAAT